MMNVTLSNGLAGMESVSLPKSATTTMHTTGFIANILSDMATFPEGLKVISFDCFDTLLWRNVFQPKDVFYRAAQLPAFTKHRLSADMRANLEKQISQQQRMTNTTDQYTLDDIYLAGFPTLTSEELTALNDAELEAEIECCFAYQPMVALLEAAHHANFKIIIVSDTYLKQGQLSRLLKAMLPASAFQAISKIYCSCEYPFSKARGLFKNVLQHERCQPHEILHIGDNPSADQAAAQKIGLATHLVMHTNAQQQEVERMHTVTAAFTDSSIRHTEPLYHPYKSLLASQHDTTTLEQALGYNTLGPLLYSFAVFLQNEIQALKVKHKQCKVLFLMRDGYMPYQAYTAIANTQQSSTCVRISRFTARACSFRTRNDVDKYLASRLKSKRYAEICKQLLLPSDLAHHIITETKNASNPEETFISLIHQQDTLQEIFTSSQAYFERFRAYLENEIDLRPGDTLIFVDLGYAGSAQTLLTPILKQELNVDIFGLYLIALETPGWESHKKGLLDPANLNNHALTMLTTYIALLEKLCASTDESVINYDVTGKPIFSKTTLSSKQHDLVKQIQGEAMRFVRDAMTSSPQRATIAIHSQYTACALGRLIFFPTVFEYQALHTLSFDFDLGTNEILPMIDEQQAKENLHKRGWLFSIKDNLESMRVNSPAEWRAVNIELVLALMSQLRHGFSLTYEDLSFRQETLPVIIHQEGTPTKINLSASVTHDGYYALHVPILPGDFHAGIQFGHAYKWLELTHIELIPLKTLFTAVEKCHSINISEKIFMSDMNIIEGKLLECLQRESMLIISAHQQQLSEHSVARIIFRPIIPV